MALAAQIPPPEPTREPEPRAMPGADGLARVAQLVCYAASAVWAGLFVAGTSFDGPDGRRYFSLFDDAMISMRYAWNLAHGHGLVWNPGERVEGYTNLLTTLLMALPQLILEPRWAVLAVQLAGLLLCVASAWMVTSKLRRTVLPEAPTAGAVAAVLLLSYYPFWYWPLMGMETGLVTLLLVLATWAAFRHVASGAQRLPWGLAALLGCLPLARPDASLFVGVLLVYLCAASPGRARSRLVAVGKLAFLAALPAVAHLAFRYGYYGSLVPNTYLLKVAGVPWDVRLHSGLAFLSPFVFQVGPILLLVASALIHRPTKEKLCLAGLLAVAAGYQIYVGGDAWHYWRILVPAMPGVFLVAAGELVRLSPGLARRFSGGHEPSPRSCLAAALAAAVILTFGAHSPMWDEWRLKSIPGVAGNAHFTRISLLLRDVLRPGASMGLFRVGAAMYYAPDKRGVDFLGKCDTHVAGRPPRRIPHRGMLTVPGHNKYDLAHSIGRLEPTYIEHFMWFDENVYELVRDRYVWADVDGVTVILRKESPLVDWSRVRQTKPL